MPKKFRGENTRGIIINKYFCIVTRVFHFFLQLIFFCLSVTAAKEKKAVHQREVDAKKQAEKERKESEEWSLGSKDTSKKEAQRLKKVRSIVFSRYFG